MGEREALKGNRRQAGMGCCYKVALRLNAWEKRYIVVKDGPLLLFLQGEMKRESLLHFAWVVASPFPSSFSLKRRPSSR